MPDRASPDDAITAALTQLALDDLPEPLWHAVVESLDWIGRLDAEAASRSGTAGPTPPR